VRCGDLRAGPGGGPARARFVNGGGVKFEGRNARVYENWTLRKAVLHHARCGACKRGRGQHGGGETENGKWHGPHDSAGEARSDAPIRASSLNRDCGLCMK
jgi:hypothetical protein